MKCSPAALAVLTILASCTSNGLLQTAHTTPPGAVRLSLGASQVLNEFSSQYGRPAAAALAGELGARLGLSSFMDIGIAPLLLTGAAIDTKVNLVPNEGAFALAPRLRLGYASRDEQRVLLVEAGVIASYRVPSCSELHVCLEPYVGLSGANHWIHYPQDVWLQSDQHLASSSGYGDGLLKSHWGIDFRMGTRLGLIAEYGYWTPLQNDPGDGFKFVDNHAFSAALRYEGGH